MEENGGGSRLKRGIYKPEKTAEEKYVGRLSVMLNSRNKIIKIGSILAQKCLLGRSEN